MEPHASIGAERGAVVVCVDASQHTELLDRAVSGVLAQTAAEVPVIVCGNQSFHAPAAPPGRTLLLLPDIPAAVAASAPADLVLLRPECAVAEGWLEGLHAAAHSGSRVATATALTGVSTTLRLPEAARAVRVESDRLRPRIAAAGHECTYIRREAVELVGGFADLEQFSRECVRRGLCHVLADDVLVQSGQTTDTRPSEARRSALSAARRALQGLTVAIDARVLTGPMNGTKIHVLELTAALAGVATEPVHALVTDDLDMTTRSLLKATRGVEVTTISRADDAGAPYDLVHRPFQVESPADLASLARLGERTIITQQDLIGYENPGYFRSPADWRNYRALTRRAMAAADQVLFFSEHVRAEALAEDLVEPQRARVVHLGVDHRLTGSHGPEPPRGAERIAAKRELMLCLGADYLHKNRLFALAIVSQLQRRHGWPGQLVFAGAHVPWGGSHAEEEQILDATPELRGAVIDLGVVSEAEKAWLFKRAALVVYPTVSEGFGLVPFEAADHDVPCLWAKGTSLSEILPDSAAAIEPWDAAVSADNALALIRDPRVCAENIEAVRAAATGLRWSDAARRLLDLYRQTVQGPPAPAGVLERQGQLMRGDLSEDAVRLVGPEGALPHDLERPLLALATHPRVRRPVFGAIRAGYRLSLRWRGKQGDGP